MTLDPGAYEAHSLSALERRHEDALDVLVCAYVGVLYAIGRAEAFGDEDAVIWGLGGLSKRSSTRGQDTK